MNLAYRSLLALLILTAWQPAAAQSTHVLNIESLVNEAGRLSLGGLRLDDQTSLQSLTRLLGTPRHVDPGMFGTSGLLLGSAEFYVWDQAGIKAEVREGQLNALTFVMIAPPPQVFTNHHDVASPFQGGLSVGGVRHEPGTPFVLPSTATCSDVAEGPLCQIGRWAVFAMSTSGRIINLSLVLLRVPHE